MAGAAAAGAADVAALMKQMGELVVCSRETIAMQKAQQRQIDNLRTRQNDGGEEGVGRFAGWRGGGDRACFKCGKKDLGSYRRDSVALWSRGCYGLRTGPR